MRPSLPIVSRAVDADIARVMCEHGEEPARCARCQQGERVWELATPFVVTRSNGGYYDDEAFAAGWQIGYLDAEMRSTFTNQIRAYVYPGVLPQLDLSAMRHGWRLVTTPWDEHPTAWALVTLTRVPAGDAGTGVPLPDR